MSILNPFLNMDKGRYLKKDEAPRIQPEDGGDASGGANQQQKKKRQKGQNI